MAWKVKERVEVMHGVCGTVLEVSPDGRRVKVRWGGGGVETWFDGETLRPEPGPRYVYERPPAR